MKTAPLLPSHQLNAGERRWPHPANAHKPDIVPIADEVGGSANVRHERGAAVALDLFAACLRLFWFSLARDGLALLVSWRGMKPRQLLSVQDQVVANLFVKFAQSPIALLICSEMNPMPASRYAALNMS